MQEKTREKLERGTTRNILEEKAFGRKQKPT